MCPEPSTSQLSFKTDWNRGEAALIWRLKHVRKFPSPQTEVVTTSETIRRRPLQYIYLQCAAGCDTRRCCKRVVPVSGFLLTFFIDQEQSVFKMIGPDRFWRAFILPWSKKRGGSCCFFCKTVSVCSNHSLHWHWVYHVYVCLYFGCCFFAPFQPQVLGLSRHKLRNSFDLYPSSGFKRFHFEEIHINSWGQFSNPSSSIENESVCSPAKHVLHYVNDCDNFWGSRTRTYCRKSQFQHDFVS